MVSKISKKTTWRSRFGFVMTVAGASVGLGNLQRFPQLVAENGGLCVCGGIFVVCVAFWISSYACGDVSG